MSIFDVRKVFTYTITTSSINYVRNYNFNSSTITDIPILLQNNGAEIPITVELTTTQPWMQLVDPNTGTSLKFPEANVILQPSSSKTVLLKIDLPTSIESIPAPTLQESVQVNIKSGSIQIVPQQTPTSPEETPTSPDTGSTIFPGPEF